MTLNLSLGSLQELGVRLIPMDILCSTPAEKLSNYRPHAVGRVWLYANNALKLIKRPKKWRRFPIRVKFAKCVYLWILL